MDKDVASEDPDDVVDIEYLEWPQGRGRDQLQIGVSSLQSFEHVGEGACHFCCISFDQCVADVEKHFRVSSHANTRRAAEDYSEVHCCELGVEPCVTALACGVRGFVKNSYKLFELEKLCQR